MDQDFLPNVNLSKLHFESDIPQDSQKLAHESDPGSSHSPQARTSHNPVEDLVPPDQVPQRSFPFRNIPNEILKSSTVENLISQNDDLMARLKVALRRLAITENENIKLKEETLRYQQRHESISDQILIWRERESAWKLKSEHFEKQKEIAIEKSGKLTLQNRSLRSELDRYHKYHDRIKNQVKPYIAQLKDFAKVLQEKNQALERDLTKKETLLEQLRFQIIEISDNAKQQLSHQERKVEDMVKYYEEHIEKQNQELQNLRSEHQILSERAAHAAKLGEKVSLLENEVIQSNRLKEDTKTRFEIENHRLKNRISELSQTATTQELELKDLKQRVLEDEALKETQESQIQDLTQQLDSLRYMWTAKNEEVDKLKTALESLEKLNVSLSEKLNDWRE